MKQKPGKFKSYLSYILLSLLLLILVGCSQDTAKDNDKAETNSEPIELTISHFVSPKHGQHTDVFEPFAEEVKSLTDGRVTVNIFPGAALGAATAHYDLATNGVADITYAIQGYTPGKFPLSSVVELPFVARNAQEGTSILWNLYEKFPEIQDEYNQNKVLWLFGIDNDQILTSKKEIKSVEDLKGLKISTPSSASNEVVEAWGAIPVFMPMNEVYEAMQKGVIDGRLGPYSAVSNFKLNEVTKYITEANFYTTIFAVTMNKNSWNKLSEADQKTIDSLLDKYRQKAADIYDRDAEIGKKEAEGSGVKINVLSTEEEESFRKPLESIHKKWLSDMKKEGLPAQEIYDEAIKLSEEFK